RRISEHATEASSARPARARFAQRRERSATLPGAREAPHARLLSGAREAPHATPQRAPSTFSAPAPLPVRAKRRTPRPSVRQAPSARLLLSRCARSAARHAPACARQSQSHARNQNDREVLGDQITINE